LTRIRVVVPAIGVYEARHCARSNSDASMTHWRGTISHERPDYRDGNYYYCGSIAAPATQAFRLRHRRTSRVNTPSAKTTSSSQSPLEMIPGLSSDAPALILEPFLEVHYNVVIAISSILSGRGRFLRRVSHLLTCSLSCFLYSSSLASFQDPK
jgi:hypothetical protein